MGQPWRRVEAIARVSRVESLMGGDPWAAFRLPSLRLAPVPVVVSRVALRALYAPSAEVVATWPLLADGGVVTELRSRA
jgi:hypothetical protein